MALQITTVDSHFRSDQLKLETPSHGGIGVYMSISKSVNIFALSFLMQPIDYEGFQLFMVTYLENDIPEELCQHLFTSFKSKTGGCSPDQSRAGTSLLGRLLVLS